MRKVNIVMYHYVRDLENSRYPRIKGLDVKIFEKQILHFIDEYNIIKMEDLLSSVKNKTNLPENALLLTFDDGYIDHYVNVFPILRKYNLQGSFFIPGKIIEENKLLDVNKIHFILASADEENLYKEVLFLLDKYRNTEYNYDSNDELIRKYAKANRFDGEKTIFVKRILQTVLPEKLRNSICDELFKKYVGIDEKIFAKELYLNLDQVKHMKQEGMYFGIHGYDHYWMNQLSEQALENDIDRALNCFEGIIDSNSWVINYPYGSYSEDVVEVIKGKNSVVGLSTVIGIADLDDDNKYILPRMDTNDYYPIISEES